MTADYDDAAEARIYCADCLKLLARLSHEERDEGLRAYCQAELVFWLGRIRELVADESGPADLRADAARCLREFLDS